MSHYTFCPKCGERIATTLAKSKNGINCIDCGEKFWPEKVERECAEGGSLTFVGFALGIGGIIACVMGLFGASAELVSIGVGALSAGVSTVAVAQLFHIRAAMEKLNSKK
jgi:hypothetical protein